MFSGNWGKGNKYWPVVSGIALVASVIAATLLYAIYATSQNWQQANQNAQEIQSQANREISESCRGTNSPDIKKCVREAYESAKNQERDEADLYAQRQMAVWALVMSVAALVSIPLSLTGIFFVWRSLEEMAEQRKISKDALEASGHANWIQQRLAEAELGPKLHFTDCTVEVSDNCYTIWIQVRNAGKSPAMNIVTRYDVKTFLGEEGSDGVTYRPTVSSDERAITKDIPAGQIANLFGVCVFDGENGISNKLWEKPFLADPTAEIYWESRFSQEHLVGMRLEPRYFRRVKTGRSYVKRSKADIEIKYENQSDKG